jgi:hypothetical protein
MRIFVTSIIFLYFLVSVLFCVADTSAIREGVNAFKSGEFDQAAKAFGKAAENSPKDLSITYNHGVALAAAGDLDGAVEVLRKSAVDRDQKIAVLSLNTLAQIHVDKAQKQLPENPIETPPEERNKIIELAAKAEQYYMDIIDIEPEDQNIKQKLEQLRTWRISIESQWDQADRIQKRQSELYNRLDWIDEGQNDIVNLISQSKEQPNSPKKYQTLYEAAGKQQKLVDEIDALRNDLKEQFTENTSDGYSELFRAVDNIRNTAAEVKQALDKFDEIDAQKKAAFSNKQLNRLALSFAPFEKIVEHAEKTQTQLINNNPFSNESKSENDSESEKNKENNNQDVHNSNSAEMDLQQQIYNQQLISSLMPLMLVRAKEGIANLQTQNLNQPPANNTPTSTPTNTPLPNQPKSNPQQKSMELAIKYAPEIQKLTANAANALIQNKHNEALPDQKQAQKLLREILNQQNQNQNQDQNNNQNQNQNQNQDQNQDQDQNQNQNNKNDQNKENDQKNNDQNSTQSQQQSADSKQDENKHDLKENEKLRQEEKAERLMRLVKRKQQEASERRKELLYHILQPSPVDKYW